MSTLTLAGLAALLLLLLALPQPARAAGSPGSRRVGGRPSLPSGAQAAGALAQSTPLALTVTLQPRDPVALAAYAQEVSTPGSSVYHHYLSVAGFAAKFGPTLAQIAAASQSLRSRGLTPGPLASDGLSFSVSASAGRLGEAFSTKFERYHLRDGRTAYANTSAPLVTGAGASVIQGVIGLNDLTVEKPQGLTPLRRGAHSTPLAEPRVSGAAAVSACSAAAGGGYTAGQIASAYGFNGLYSAGDTAFGITVALYELAPYSSADISAYQSCYGTSTSVTQTNVDGGVSCPTGKNRDPNCELEDVLDIEDVIGLAPKSNIRVYEGPNSDKGAYDTYARIISDDVAKVISTSWGVCESQAASASAGTPTAENTLFEEAAAQGQTVLAAAGDNGTTDCMSGGNPIAARAVDDPASQPYVTGVGGTSLNSVSPVNQTVWNDYPTEGLSGGSGGGGVSALWPRPSYQSGFSQSQSSITCGSAGFACREVPDVAANADPNTGYAIYFGGWMPVGGTSGAAPTWASLIALADASSACTTPVGFANPGLYAGAREAYVSNFSDVTSGNNSYDRVAGYAARTGYDMASGLGSPKGTELAAALCGSVGDSVALTSSPGRQKSTAGRAIRPVTISATSRRGANPITYSASGLPRGLSIDASSGRVMGTPHKRGRYSVTLKAVDQDGMVATDWLTWTVKAPAVRLRAVSRRITRVGQAARIVLHATDSVGAPLTYRATHLPRGLHMNRRTGVISGRPTRRLTRKVTVKASDAYGGSAKRRFTVVVRPRG